MNEKKEYWIKHKEDKNRQGAFTFGELIKMDIYDDSLVWKAGWEDWKNSKEVEKLGEYIIFKPPPTNEEKEIVHRKERIKTTLSKAPSKILKLTIIILICIVLTALLGALFDLSGQNTIGIYGWGIIAVWCTGVYFIYGEIRRNESSSIANSLSPLNATEVNQSVFDKEVLTSLGFCILLACFALIPVINILLVPKMLHQSVLQKKTLKEPFKNILSLILGVLVLLLGLFFFIFLSGVQFTGDDPFQNGLYLTMISIIITGILVLRKIYKYYVKK